MTPVPIVSFGDFRLLDTQLLREGIPVPLTPKAFAVLTLLCRSPGRLVTKNELLDEVWARSYISDGVVKNAVQELRRALGDDAKSPLYIETVHRRGYRFIAEMVQRGEGSEARGQPYDIFVGRDLALCELDSCLATAVLGRTTTVFVRGEPGIGKSALIESFRRRAGIPAIVGQCIAQYGQGEPYLPVLDALNQLAREDNETCVPALRHFAPTWLAQLPWLVHGAERESLLRETQGVTRHRMLRELAEFLGAWTEGRPLLLVIEDLHWSDHATVDAIAYLARRAEAARLMILCSYRPAELLLDAHSFRRVRDDLLLQRLCRDLPLDTLSLEDVGSYLRTRFPHIRTDLVRAIYHRTEGLPLFLVRVAGEMAKADEGLGEHGQLLASLPEGLMHLVRDQLERLPSIERKWLDVAAVLGDGFTASTLAGVTGTSDLDVEEWCARLVHASHLIRVFPEGRIMESGDSHDPRYAFIHAYYREQAYSLLPPARKSALHASCGEWLEHAAGPRADIYAAQLAAHFEQGRLYLKSVQYYHQAAYNALARHATFEAAQLLQRGIELLDTHFMDVPQHADRLLTMLTMLPATLTATRGYAVPELPALYERALSLATRLGMQQAEYLALYKIWMFRCSSGALATARELSERLVTAADVLGDPMQRMSARFALGATLYHMGQGDEARLSFIQGLNCADSLGSAGDRIYQVYGEDVHAIMLAMHGLNENLSGRPEDGLDLMERARARAERIGHPYSLAATIICSAWLYRDRGEAERVRDVLPRLEALATAHGYPFITLIGNILRGWASAVLEGDTAGIRGMQDALKQMESTGSRVTRPIYHHQIAHACLSLKRYDEGFAAVESALSEIAFSGERRYEAESWLLRGQLMRDGGGRGGETAECCFEKAMKIAQGQNARLLAVRIAMEMGDMEILRKELEPLSKGVGTSYVQRARALLKSFDKNPA